MADKLFIDSGSVTEVYQAARDGSSKLTKLLKRLKTEQRKTALETKTKDGNHFATPLIIAAHNGQLNSVKSLLEYGADIEARGMLKIEDKVSIEGCTPLLAAAASGYLHVVKLLIRRKANVEGRTSTGATPLRAAAYKGHIDIVKYLVEWCGADVNARNNYDSTPLKVACYCGHSSVVTYLINKGASINLQSEDGTTALHVAVQGGHKKIVLELLALGASQTPNDLGLTPLLYACDECSIEMVEHIINRPECTKEQRIDALELLGATIANNDKCRDTEKAFSYMKLGMEMRYEDPAHPLLKRKMEPVEAYQNTKESQTPEDLALLEGDDHAIGLEGLIIRERILGSDNPAILYPIRYRGSLLANSGQYDLCVGLWLRAAEKAMNSDVPIAKWLTPFPGVFGEMVQRRKLLRPDFIEDVFKILVAASEKRAEKLKSSKSLEGHESEEQEKTFYCALYLLMIYTKVKVQNAKMTEFLQRFLRLNPRANDGNTLLHLAAWQETSIKVHIEDNVLRVCKLPCVETMKLILHAGCDVNAVNTEGNTPLHLAVKYKPAEPEDVEILREMLLLLLDIGADPKLANRNGQTPLDSCETDEARRILSGKKGPSAMNLMNVDVGQDGKIGSGTGKRRGEARFVPGTEKDLKENTQKETVTKLISKQSRELTQMLESVQEQLRQRDKQLREATQQLTNVQVQLNERDGQLRQMTEQLTNAEGRIQERDGQLKERTSQLTDVQVQLLESDGQLRQMTEHLTNVERQLREKDGQLRQMAQQLTNFQGQLHEIDGQLREKTSQLTNVEGQLREKDGQLRQMTQQLTNVEGQLQDLVEGNTSLEEQLRSKEQEVNELDLSLLTCQLALSELSRQQSPDWVISRDQIQLTEKCIGKGGWGSVIEGKYCGCTVAVKQIYEVLLNLSSHNREMFEREMSIASKCRHPCLLQFIGATNDEGSPLFVTELLESSLRKLLEQRSVSTAEVAVISLDVARALNYLHQKKPRPIIHRDISSANVLLWRQADQWRGKVSDYGAANFLKHTLSVCPGAAVYSAPEVITKTQTVKVDVYSFGVLLCEMSIGELPDPDRREEQVAMVTNRALRALIQRCLHQDPQERPNMEDIIGELEKLV